MSLQSVRDFFAAHQLDIPIIELEVSTATVALINPRIGTFNVTAKGGLVAQPYFDWGISRPYTILVLLNFLAFGVGLGRLFFWNTHETATVLLNLLWTAYSILILGAALGVAAESRQVRRMHRVNTRMPATLFLDDGLVLHAQCVDFSMTGVGLHMAAGMDHEIEFPDTADTFVRAEGDLARLTVAVVAHQSVGR